MLDKIEVCGNKYLECFSRAEETTDFIRLSDDLLPDMYQFNCTIIINAANAAAIVQAEIEHSKSRGKNFCQICGRIGETLDPLSGSEVSVMGYYVFDVNSLHKLKDVDGIEIVKLDSAEKIADLVALDIEVDGEAAGEDFCTRRAQRRGEAYLSSVLDRYLCYIGGEIIGKCELFIHEDCAKIEDLEISPKFERRGYGTALLKAVIEAAIKKGAKLIFLVTDEDDTVKHMYEKIGFAKVCESVELFFKLD